MADEKKTEVLDAQFEESWNASVEDLRKSVGLDNLSKARQLPEEEDEEEGDETAPEEEGETEDEEEEEHGPAKSKMPPQFAKKSMEDTVSEDAEAEAAMDVEPFLRQLVKAFDIAMAGVLAKVTKIEAVQKSMATVTLKSAELQKSVRDTLKLIGETPQPRQGALLKSGGNGTKFGAPEGKQFSKTEILAKSHELLVAGKLKTNEATLVEVKLNRNTFNPESDAFSKSIMDLITSEGGK
jgi:hypothetical protein